MTITRTITVTLTAEEAQDFATNELGYKALLERTITVVDVEATEEAPATTHFEQEEYENPVSVDQAVTAAVDAVLSGTVNTMLAAYKERKQIEAVAEVQIALEGARTKAIEALTARQNEVVKISS